MSRTAASRLPAGVRVGHWDDQTARTGCTVVLMPSGTVASGEVRGGAPGTREWALLEPGRSVDRVDAVVLAGGSAFGLAACDGVVRWCEERGLGVPTPAGPVPIVVGMVIYDLAVGDPRVRPGPLEGYAAAQAATPEPPEGRVGAGCGATANKWDLSNQQPMPGGLALAGWAEGDLVVSALVVVNALGGLREGGPRDDPRIPSGRPFGVSNTTLGVVTTNARLDKVGCLKMAESGHDGLARALDPVHTAYDGDALVVGATGQVEAPLAVLAELAAWSVEEAVRAALGH